MNYLSIFLISFVIALSGALAPGPLLTTVIAKSARHGFKAGPLIILGHAVLEVLMIILIALGLSNLINQPYVIKIISIFGAAILFLFGINMLKSIKNISLKLEAEKSKNSNLALLGITMSIASPYWSIWWLTIGLGLVLGAGKLGFTGIGVFFAGHIIADLIWYSIVSLTISKSKRFISDKTYKIIIFICGLILIGFGIYFSITIFR
ncbi:MAG: LysE family transporter [Candidatus Kaelpia aquatica]|nr:LysE family transporter [Candidatus Kaelpia aquatica]